MLAGTTRHILIREEDGLFVVEVLPPPTEGAGFDQTFATYKSAYSYGRGVRLCTGWELVDQADAHA